MAVHMNVVHSSIMRGVGVIAGVVYDCANIGLGLTILQRGTQVALCLDGSVDFAAFSIARTDAASNQSHIDNTQYLAQQKVWLFSGYNDGAVRRGAMNAVDEYFKNYVSPGNVNSGNIFYKTNNHAPHALITDDYGGPCLSFKAPYVNNCQYDAAGHLLEHIYGRLNSPGKTLSSSPQPFDQREFEDPTLVGQVGLADTGYIYVPDACKTETCRVHVVFHGCKQNAGNPEVGDAVYNHGGYNKWADKNNIIVLYPQTEPVTIPGLKVSSDGCWDWWGYIRDNETDFAQKTGYQISAIRKMLDRLAGGPAHGGGSSGTFGKPQHVSVADSTSSSLALIWQPNSAATGFNVYRSSKKTGTYTKINSSTVTGASFADRGLTPNTTYYYKITAIDGTNQESAYSATVHKKTAATPPACDPYFSDNLSHVAAGRAVPDLFGNARALGPALELMGPNDNSHFSELIKDGLLPVYHVRYCP
jgi:hypothetical protein